MKQKIKTTVTVGAIRNLYSEINNRQHDWFWITGSVTVAFGAIVLFS